jgi:hypothetical protein
MVAEGLVLTAAIIQRYWVSSGPDPFIKLRAHPMAIWVKGCPADVLVGPAKVTL